jgi:hypothetical protein
MYKYVLIEISCYDDNDSIFRCNLEIGIMKLGQFTCLGNLQRLKNRFGHGYAVQVKLPLGDINTFKEELMLTLPGVQIDGKLRLIYILKL